MIYVRRDIGAPSTSTVKGRPQKDFSECCSRTKNQKIKQMLQNRTLDELTYAAEVGLRRDGKRDAAELVLYISSKLKN